MTGQDRRAAESAAWQVERRDDLRAELRDVCTASDEAPVPLARVVLGLAQRSPDAVRAYLRRPVVPMDRTMRVFLVVALAWPWLVLGVLLSEVSP